MRGFFICTPQILHTRKYPLETDAIRRVNFVHYAMDRNPRPFEPNGQSCKDYIKFFYVMQNVFNHSNFAFDER